VSHLHLSIEKFGDQESAEPLENRLFPLVSDDPDDLEELSCDIYQSLIDTLASINFTEEQEIKISIDHIKG
jgi:hypothetical protein